MKALKLFVPALVLGALGCILFLGGCGPVNKLTLGAVKIPNYAHFKIDFKADTKPNEREMAVAELDKYIINFIASQGFVIKQITITHNYSADLASFEIGIDIGGDASSGAVSTVRPRPVPKMEVQNLSPIFISVEQMPISVK